MSPDVSSPPEHWRITDAVWAVLAGLGASIVASLAVGVDELTVVELFGIIAPAQTLGSVAATAFMARRRQPWRTALGIEAVPSDGVGLLIGVGLQFVL